MKPPDGPELYRRRSVLFPAGCARRARRRRWFAGHDRPDPDGGQRRRIARRVFLDAVHGVLAVAEILHVRHQVRESRFRDEVQPFALRRFVGRFGAAAEKRDLRPCVHREATRAARGTAALSRGIATATAAARAEPPAAARLAGFRIAVVDRRVLVDLLIEDVRPEAVRPLAIARLMA